MKKVMLFFAVAAFAVAVNAQDSKMSTSTTKPAAKTTAKTSTTKPAAKATATKPAAAKTATPAPAAK